LIVEVDRYLGSEPLKPGEAFLVKAQIVDSNALNDASIQLPDGLATTAPAVHVPSENEVAWRVVAAKAGVYVINIQVSDQTFSKQLIVGSGLQRLSTVRLRGKVWERIFVSGEPALPSNNFVDAISVQYPARNIAFAGIDWNWIWLFFILSLAAGFLFKSILGIEI